MARTMDAQQTMAAVLAMLLVAAATALAAAQCDLGVSRCPCGHVVRLYAGRPGCFSVVEFANDSSGAWQVHEVEGRQVTTTHSNGSSSVGQRDQLDFGLFDKLRRWEMAPTLGGQNYGFSRGSQHLAIGLDHQSRFRVLISGKTVRLADPKAGEFAAINLSERWPVGSLLVQNSSVVTMVDRSCKLSTRPMSSLSAEQRELVAQITGGKGPKRRQQQQRRPSQVDQRLAPFQ